MRPPFRLILNPGEVYHRQVSDKERTMSEETQEPPKDLPPAAQRALAEAAERRARAEVEATEMPTELGGRIKGLEPVRYGDWEKKGLAIDF
jgi:hypothetical protein